MGCAPTRLESAANLQVEPDIGERSAAESLPEPAAGCGQPLEKQTPTSPALTNGVSLAALRAFVAQHAGRLAGLSTGDVCSQIVLPATEARRCAYADLLRGSSGSDGRPCVAPATVFVSHAWGNSFLQLVDAIEARAAQEEREHHAAQAADAATAERPPPPPPVFWLDILVVDQWRPAEERPTDWWTGAFRSAIVEIGHVYAVRCWFHLRLCFLLTITTTLHRRYLS